VELEVPEIEKENPSQTKEDLKGCGPNRDRHDSYIVMGITSQAAMSVVLNSG